MSKVIWKNGKAFHATEGYEIKVAEKPQIELDLSLIDNIEVDGIDTRDYPDFCDAYISYADYDGREMTDEELDVLNDEYRDFVYEKVWDSLF